MSQNFITRITRSMPRGVGSLLLIQLFSIITFSVLFSTLLLYTTEYLHMSDVSAMALVTSFMAFNFTLHVLGGFIGGRYFSYRTLFLLGVILDIVASILLTWTNIDMMYWGLAAFITGAGLNFTCINCIYTQLFKPEDKRRESAFLWNYSVMNLGFLIGFYISGYFQLHQNYHSLFLVCILSNVITLLIVITNWKKLADRSTYFVTLTKPKVKVMGFKGIFIIIALFFLLRYLIMQSTLSIHLITAVGIFMGFALLLLTFRQPTEQARQKMIAFLILLVASICFWALSLLAPMGLTLFIERNVMRHMLGVVVPPQWYNSVNTIIIIISGPILALIFQRLRHKGYLITIPIQFTIALFLIGFAFILLPIGIQLAGPHGYVNTGWVVFAYALQGLGEVFLQPIGLAMIGQIAPVRLQGIMMGTWMMVTGIAAVVAGHISNWMLGADKTVDPLYTNYQYAHSFKILGWSAVGLGVVLLILTPFLTKLIQYRSLDPTINVNN